MAEADIMAALRRLEEKVDALRTEARQVNDEAGYLSKFQWLHTIGLAAIIGSLSMVQIDSAWGAIVLFILGMAFLLGAPWLARRLA